MKDAITTVIISIIIILLLIVFGFFGVIFWNEFKNIQSSFENQEVEAVSTEFSDTMENEIQVPKIIENPLDELENSQSSSNTNVNYDNN